MTLIWAMLLDMTPKTQATKAKAPKYYYELKSCTAKEIVKIRPPVGWNEMSVSNISGKGLPTKIHKELLQLNSKIIIK